MIYLITATGNSGKKYSVWFECEDAIDAEVMARDCLNGVVEGELVELVDFLDNVDNLMEQLQ